jgi:hypothetical protein
LKVIDLEEVRNRSNDEIKVLCYEAPPEDLDLLLRLTDDGNVVFFYRPREGVMLTQPQAEELGKLLIKYAAQAELFDELEEEAREREGDTPEDSA